MPLTFQFGRGLGQGISQAGGALSQALGQYAQNRQQKTQQTGLQTALNKVLTDAQGNPRDLSDPMVLGEVLREVVSRPGGAQALQSIAPYITPQLKANAQSQRTQRLLKSLGILPDEMEPTVEAGRGMASGEPPEDAFSGVPTTDALQGNGPGNSLQSLTPKQQGLERFSQTQLQGMLADPSLEKVAQSELDRRQNEKKERRKSFEADRDYETQLAKPVVDNYRKLAESNRRLRGALNVSRRAIESGDVNSFGRNQLAETIGGPIGDILRTAQGAAFLTAGKENLFGNLGRVSARAQNQYMERRTDTMFPKIGQSREANLSVQQMIDDELLLGDIREDAFKKLAQEDVNQHGYVRGSTIENRIDERARPLEQFVENRGAFRMRQIEESQNGYNWMRNRVGKEVSRGTPLTKEMAKMYVDKFGSGPKGIRAAVKNGYTLVSPKQMELYKMTPDEIRRGGFDVLER